MLVYIAKRLLGTLPTLVLVTIAVFMFVHVPSISPNDCWAPFRR